MRILIFDSNVVFAKSVGKAVEEHMPHATVEYARNLPILRDRLCKSYDLILADVMTTLDVDLALQELRQARSHGANVFIWHCLDRSHEDVLKSFTSFSKPQSSSEMEKVVDTLVHAG